MSIEAHLAELERRHRALETEIAEAHAHPSIDDLQIASLKRRCLSKTNSRAVKAGMHPRFFFCGGECAFDSITTEAVRTQRKETELTTEAVQSSALAPKSCAPCVPEIASQMHLPRFIFNQPRPEQKFWHKMMTTRFLNCHG